ncbi:T9SS type A sorting domain-containing protein [Seonamhaeicola marinus]|uniref:T9SS type A sorting domain-containing protein n=1 Tax=Seonamhaeicola marinus TaxID=1912246 RepID=A0A5D0HKL7_9FLAO|nr:T9SS type A sorting domain-containing protein [Seonamhaeicola marinus]TYA71838.1 T9SS type A sorting domain-containing protein [Seonamhaeicola marinus]
MKKITLLTVFAFTYIMGNAQLSITFEEGAAVLSEQTAGPTTDVTEYTYFSDQDTGGETLTTTVQAIPGGTTGNSSTRAMRIENAANTANWHIPLVHILGTALVDTNGNFITLKILPASTGATTFRLGLKVGGNDTVNYDVAYNPTSTTEWITVGVDITGFAAGVTRLEFGFEFGTRGSDMGEVTWIDDVMQVSSLSTSDNVILAQPIDFYPNPTNGIINIFKPSRFERIQIYDLLGKEVKSFKSQDNLDVSDLVSGVYVIKTNTGLGKKIVKE